MMLWWFKGVQCVMVSSLRQHMGAQKMTKLCCCELALLGLTHGIIADISDFNAARNWTCPLCARRDGASLFDRIYPL